MAATSPTAATREVLCAITAISATQAGERMAIEDVVYAYAKVSDPGRAKQFYGETFG
jgi:hypothetical protein